MVDDIKDQPLSLTFRHFPNEEFVAFFLLFSANFSPKLSSMPCFLSLGPSVTLFPPPAVPFLVLWG